MALIPWKSKRHDEGDDSAMTPAFGFRSEMDRLFDSFLRDAFHWGDRPDGGLLPVDVEEGDKEITVRAEIPGVTADDLQLEIRGGALIVAGEKKETNSGQQGAYFYQERRFGSFRREVPLPCAVDADDVNAEYREGVLTVRLKKAQEALARRIQVQSG